jgi:hypothetical protein
MKFNSGFSAAFALDFTTALRKAITPPQNTTPYFG